MKATFNFIYLLVLLALIALATSGAESNKNSSNTHDDSNEAQIIQAKAIFAGGCFWCMEPPFDKLDGVLSTVSGYTGGHTENPTYEQVSSDLTGHYEAVEITYNPNKIDYKTLLTVFWHNIDPLDPHGQFCDKGNSYRTAIFYLNDKQKELAEASKKQLIDSGIFKDEVVTVIEPVKTFYPAEEYHQDYYQKNTAKYKFYRYACKRDKRLKELWNISAGKADSLIPPPN